ncbi:MAG: DUF262 domain-containing protein [Bacilli bacterium]|nr:DUF262 domain-containing protein [Bacilli bacterium]
MEAKEKEILNELISGTKCQFVIPVFQRNYDWRIKDCEKLFDDIIDLATDKDHPERKHFMGAFVCKFTRFVDTNYNQFTLIDGQQRLTSITLILKALYDYLEQFGDKYDEVRSEIQETYLINKFAKDYTLRLKLKPNQLDNDNFNNLMDGKEVDINSTIGRNYNVFKKRIEKMAVPFEDFYNALQRLEGVVVYLDDTDNPQVIFESLNSTGLELTDVDLIRNYLLMNCKPSEQEELYKNYWLKIEQLLDNKFLQFVRDYLSFKNGIVTPSTKNIPYTTFQKYYKKNDYSRAEFMEHFYSMAKIYTRLLKPQADEKVLREALEDFVSLDMATTYPFVFGLLIDNTPDEEGRKKISDDCLAKILRLLEAYLIRRNVCNLAGGGLSQVMASLYNDIIKRHGDEFYKDSYRKIASALAGISTKAYFPRDDEFVRELTTRDMYHSRNIAYILQKMETFKQSKEIIDFNKITIEHVMPQQLSKEWIKYLDRSDYEKYHEMYCNRLGNLTLTAYNSEMSNKLYSEKKSHMDFSRLTLNKYFDSVDDWKNESCIDDRAAELSKLAIQLWPYPKVANIEDIATESHFLLEDEEYDYMGTNPAGIIIRDEKIIEDSWSNLYASVIKYLYKENKELLLSLLSNKDLFNSERFLISNDKNDIKSPQLIADGLYVETNNNTDRKIKILKVLFENMQYEVVDIIIYIK